MQICTEAFLIRFNISLKNKVFSFIFRLDSVHLF